MKLDKSTRQESPKQVDLLELERLLDANFNRAAEGLRVVEDVLRLVRNDAVLSRQAKRIRHALADILAKLDAQSFVLSRNVVEDVGRTAQTDQEFSRESTNDLLVANLKRAQQSLRVIEECLKPLSRSLATGAEALRYDVYQLEHAAVAGEWGRQQLESCALYVLIDGRNDLERFEALAHELVEAAIDVIQLRDKSLTDRELLARGHILGRLTKNRATRWIMNDRADLAALAGADGVHLGQSDVSVAQARRLVGKSLWIGVSTHSLEQAAQAIIDGANYIGVGPTFASRTKSFDRLSGVELIEQVTNHIAIPFFAIGGISLDNVDLAIHAGARRIAVGDAIIQAVSPSAAVRDFRSKLRATTCGEIPQVKSI